MIRLALAASLALAMASGPLAAPALADPEFRAFGPVKLAEGLEIITLEDKKTPEVTVDTWIKAGSAQDFTGYPGLAAATATAVLGDPALASGLKALGAEAAFHVYRDATHLSVTAPAERVAEAMTLVGNAIARPAWDHVSLERVQRSLGLQRERQSADEAASDRLMATLFGPDYGHAVTGHPAAVKQLTVADMQAFADRYYVPERLKVVLVGDLDTGRSVGQVVNGYAGVLKRAATAGAAPTRPLAAAPLGWDRKETRLVFGALGPAAPDQKGQATMELLSAVLAERLHAALGSRATDVSVAWQMLGGPGVLTVQLKADPASRMELEKTVRDALAELRAKGSRLVLAAYDAANASIAQRAETLGLYATVAGDHRLARTYPDVVRQVSRMDILEAAQKHLTPDQVKLVVLTP